MPKPRRVQICENEQKHTAEPPDWTSSFWICQSANDYFRYCGCDPSRRFADGDVETERVLNALRVLCTQYLQVHLYTLRETHSDTQ